MHLVVNLFEVEGFEFIPLSQNENSVRVFACFISAFAIADELVVGADTEILLNLSNLHLRVIDRDLSQLFDEVFTYICLLYTSPSPRDGLLSRMPSSA